jgi:hypothetical protein
VKCKETSCWKELINSLQNITCTLVDMKYILVFVALQQGQLVNHL